MDNKDTLDDEAAGQPRGLTPRERHRKFARWADHNSRSLQGKELRQILQMYPSGIHPSSAYRVLVDLGILGRRAYLSRFEEFWRTLNWELPDGTLEEVWGISRGNLASRRHRMKMGPPRFDRRADYHSAYFQHLVREERLKQRAFRGERPSEAVRKHPTEQPADQGEIWRKPARDAVAAEVAAVMPSSLTINSDADAAWVAEQILLAQERLVWAADLAKRIEFQAAVQRAEVEDHLRPKFMLWVMSKLKEIEGPLRELAVGTRKVRLVKTPESLVPKNFEAAMAWARAHHLDVVKIREEVDFDTLLAKLRRDDQPIPQCFDLWPSDEDMVIS